MRIRGLERWGEGKEINDLLNKHAIEGSHTKTQRHKEAEGRGVTILKIAKRPPTAEQSFSHLLRLIFANQFGSAPRGL